VRELNFVPPWYRDLLRRRRSTFVHVGAMGLLLAGVVAGAVQRQGQIRAAERELSLSAAELGGTRGDLRKLDALRQLRDQWRRQEEVLTSTGVNVEASRLLSVLSKVVPPDTALTDVSFAVTEPERNGPSAAAADAQPAATQPAAGGASRPAARRLNVSLRGVAPGELAVANVLAGISKTPLFRHVNLTYAKDREDHQRTVREFEVTFTINLDADGSIAEEQD
jgi:Tfp pilus assembly protein PilN